MRVESRRIPARHPQHPERTVPVEVRARRDALRRQRRHRRHLRHRSPAARDVYATRRVRDRHGGARHEHRGAEEGAVREQPRAASVFHHERDGRPYGSRLGPHSYAAVACGGREVRPGEDRRQLLSASRLRGRQALRGARQVRPHSDRRRTPRDGVRRAPGKLRPRESRLRIRPRSGAGRNGGNHPRRGQDGHRTRRQDGDLLVPVGLLRISRVVVRGAQRRDGALQVRIGARRPMSTRPAASPTPGRPTRSAMRTRRRSSSRVRS